MWQDEIKDAVYTSPSGKVFTFKYNSGLSSETDLKTATFTFPEKDGALVVPLGLGGSRFPMTCKFFGAECFSEAAAFEAGLKERGYGELQHPIYGVHKVVPTGTIKRSDDVVSELNVSTVEIVFAETIIDEAHPESKIVSVDELEDAVSKLEEVSAAEFAKDMDMSSVKENIRSQNRLRKNIRGISGTLQEIAKKSKSVYSNFQQVALELESNIDRFVGAVNEVAVQSIRLMRLPSTIAIGAMEKIEGYASVFKSIKNNLESDALGFKAAKNQFASTKMILGGLVGSVASGVAIGAQGSGEVDSPASESRSEAGTSFVINSGISNLNDGDFKSREDAVNAAMNILQLWDDFNSYCDEKLKDNLNVDTGESYFVLRDLISYSVDIIINHSFDLPTRKIVTLTRDRQLMELMAELYGNFEHVDEFIIDNNLTYDEIELIPMGRQVAYYE